MAEPELEEKVAEAIARRMGWNLHASRGAAQAAIAAYERERPTCSYSQDLHVGRPRDDEVERLREQLAKAEDVIDRTALALSGQLTEVGGMALVVQQAAQVRADLDEVERPQLTAEEADVLLRMLPYPKWPEWEGTETQDAYDSALAKLRARASTDNEENER
jgi:hypothetical protein